MLKGVVQDDGLGVGPVMQQLRDGDDPLLPYRYGYVGEFAVELHRFIPDIQRGSRFAGQGIAACLSFITPAEDGDGKPVL